jgi:hypothetical protein
VSTAGRRRIDKVEGSLTPRQVVLLWLEEATQFSSLREYVLSIKDQPNSAFPLFRLPDQVEQSARRAMRGKPHDEVERAVRSSVRDVAFLYYLVVQINSRELMERRANSLHLMLVIERLCSFLSNEPLSGSRHAQWLEFVAALGLRLYGFASAADHMGRQYFGGRSPLFPESAECLASLLAQLEGMIELYNDRLGDEAPRPKRGRGSTTPAPLDAKELQARSADGATALVQEPVTTAKTEALLMMGERTQAFALMGEGLEVRPISGEIE